MDWIKAIPNTLPENDFDCLIRVVDMRPLKEGEKRHRQTLTGYIQEKSHIGLHGELIKEREWVVHIATNQWSKWVLNNGGLGNETRIVTHWKPLDSPPEDENNAI